MTPDRKQKLEKLNRIILESAVIYSADGDCEFTHGYR